ncbi:MAG: Clp1/GlmU family protein [Candidatus Bathyarchaeota archaeon]|nr:Clp1/GlmU family protein [Candidatus Bathyarchaeota archaeon]
MIREVKAEKTLLLKGPVSIRLVSGEVEAFGAHLRVEETVVIRDEKWLPLHVRRDASFEIMQSENSLIEEVDENTVPHSWLEAAETIFAMGKPKVVAIIGALGSGKTSLCTFLTNNALEASWKVAVIDSDLGQSDIGPPATVGLAYVTESIIDLYLVKANAAYFVGQTNPRGAEDSIANSISLLKKQALSRNTDLLIVNTDGWIESAAAIRYKTMLVKTTAPDIIISTGGEEIAPLLNELRMSFVLSVDAPRIIPRRSIGQRKNLRELSYKRHFKHAKTLILPLDWTKVEIVNSSLSTSLLGERPKEVIAALGTAADFCAETSESIWAIVGRDSQISPETLCRAEETLGKAVRVMSEGDEKGLVAGLHDEENRFLGLGIVVGFNFRRRNVKVLTNVTKGVTTVRLGKVRLDDQYREAGFWQTEEINPTSC